jgi:hypothetical protein
MTEAGLQLQRRSFELWPLVESVLRDLQPVAGTARTRLVNQVPDELFVNADASLLRRTSRTWRCRMRSSTRRADR